MIDQRPDTPRPHPAKYNDDLLDVIAAHLEPGWKVLDPMAGVGRIHELADRAAVRTWGVELEHEWASQHDRTVCYDARRIGDLFQPGAFDAVVTSPGYGNRMADAYDGSRDTCKACDGAGCTFVEHSDRYPKCEQCGGSGFKPSRRHTYRIDLGRQLTEGSGAALQWGPAYRRLHAEIWDAVVPMTSRRFILNIKNHVRDGAVQRVAEWHITYLLDAGLTLTAIDPVAATGIPHGANAAERVDHELVVVFDHPGPDQLALEVTP